MGLDNFAYKRVAIEDEEFKGIDLCGGMLSGGSGSSSIRGKAYADLVEELTGHSMYNELDENTVVQIAENLCTFAKRFNEVIEKDEEETDVFEIRKTTDSDGHTESKEWVYLCPNGNVESEYYYTDIVNLAAWFKAVADNEGHVCAWF